MNGNVQPNCVDVPLRINSLTHSGRLRQSMTSACMSRDHLAQSTLHPRHSQLP